MASKCSNKLKAYSGIELDSTMWTTVNHIS